MKTVQNIIRLHPSTRAGKAQWLVQLTNGSTALMTASEIVADSRGGK